MNEKYEVLFTPTKIGSVDIKNRFVMCPMGGIHVINWVSGDGYDNHARDFLIERAKDGIGLLIPGTISLYSFTKGGWLHENKWAFDGVTELIDEIHKHGSKIFFQLTAGAGRNYPLPKNYEVMIEHGIDLGRNCASPDEGLPNVWIQDYKTRAITKEEIHDLVYAYGQTALLCKENGVDGVEVHAVHEGYLMDQFTMPYTNHRTDEYGGSLENRYRFACEVVKEIKKVCGEDYPVMLRYSVTSKVKDFNEGIIPQDNDSQDVGRTMEESEEAIKLLRDAGYDAFNCDNGTYDSWYWSHPPVYMPLNCNLPHAKHISKYTDAPIGCAGRMQLDDAAEAVADGSIDFVGIARQLLTDEQFLTKIKEDRLEDIRPCISCHAGCMPIGMYKDSGCLFDITSQQTGVCALYPRTLNEKKYSPVKAMKPRKIAVIGGGIAGMEFAIQAAERGHDVSLYEKTDKLGGVFIAAAAPSFKEKDKDLLKWYERTLNNSDVKVFMNHEIKELSEIEAEEYVIATGASQARKLKVLGSEKCISATDYLLGDKMDGDKVAIVGGGLTGCEIAYELALQGKNPVIIEMLDDIIKAPGVSMANSSFLRDALKYYKVPVYLESSIVEVKDNSVVIQCAEGQKEIHVDTVVTSIGYLNGNPFVEKETSNIHILGDSYKVANLNEAIWDANDLAVELSK